MKRTIVRECHIDSIECKNKSIPEVTNQLLLIENRAQHNGYFDITTSVDYSDFLGQSFISVIGNRWETDLEMEYRKKISETKTKKTGSPGISRILKKNRWIGDR